MSNKTRPKSASPFIFSFSFFPEAIYENLISNLCRFLSFDRGSSHPSLAPLIGSFSNDDGDGNEDVKKQQVYYAKQQLCTCITRFCTFLYRPCTTTTWKCLISSFMDDVNKRRRISFSLSKLECGPQEINSREIRLHLPFSANWNKHDKDWKNGNSFKNWRFRCRCRRRC